MNDIIKRAAELLQTGTHFVLATIVHSEGSTPRNTGTRMIVYEDGSVEGTIGGGALENRVVQDGLLFLNEGRSEKVEYDLGRGEEGVPLDMVCGGTVEVLIETFGQSWSIFIFGAGHVGRKLAELCDVLNFSYWIVDDRAEYAREELFPGAAGVVHSDFKESFARLPIDGNSYIIIATYGHNHDGVCLSEALKTGAAYIGMMGSRRKVKTLVASVAGMDGKGDPRLYAPIGLKLGDNSPEELGISILSEILRIRSGGSGEHMRLNG
jgi:xanthine dehydrogenase accessory factor